MEFTLESLKKLVRPGSCVLVQGERALHHVARMMPNLGGKLRAPHHTVSDHGALGELAIAAGGTLYLDEFLEFRRHTLRCVFSTWAMVSETFRPTLVLGLDTSSDRFSQKSRHDELWQLLNKLAALFPPIDAHFVVWMSGNTVSGEYSISDSSQKPPSEPRTLHLFPNAEGSPSSSADELW